MGHSRPVTGLLCRLLLISMSVARGFVFSSLFTIVLDTLYVLTRNLYDRTNLINKEYDSVDEEYVAKYHHYVTSWEI